MSSESSIFGDAQDREDGSSRTHLVTESDQDDEAELKKREKRLRTKVDFRLCSIAGLLCSLNLLDSGIISSASVTSMLSDLGLDKGNRYSVSILIFTVASICFQLPATIAVRLVGPRIFFSIVTVCFCLITVVGNSMLIYLSVSPASYHYDCFFHAHGRILALDQTLNMRQCTAFIHTWKQMIFMRVLLGVSMVFNLDSRD